jgi:hypothetical protein
LAAPKPPFAAATDEAARSSSPESRQESPLLVFDSLAGLVEHAGIPKGGDVRAGVSADVDESYPPGSVVEADLEFRCVDLNSYVAERQEREAKQPLRRAEGRALPSWLETLNARDRDDPQEDDLESQSSSPEEESGDEAVDCAAFLQSLRDDRRRGDDYYSSEDDNEDGSSLEGYIHDPDGEDDDESRGEKGPTDPPFRRRSRQAVAPAPPSRPFLVLWKALTQWATPQAALYLKQSSLLNSQSRPFEPVQGSTTDVAAGRLGGLHAQLRLHVRPALESLQFVDDRVRLAWIRLGDLLRCFSYVRPMPDLDGAHLRALTVVLLHSVLRGQEGSLSGLDGGNEHPRSQGLVPEPCADLGLSPGEYRALTVALLRLGRDDSGSDDERASEE